MPEIEAFIARFGLKQSESFRLLEKADVNGEQARPVFHYMQNMLPGAFGNFIKWNFTKFLVDPSGIPISRYSPKTSPLAMEEDIVAALDAAVGR